MMDLALLFSSAQAANGAGDVDSTDWVDFKKAMDLGAGDEPVLEVRVATAPTVGTSVEFKVLACDNAGANGVVIATTGAIAIASLPVGRIVHLKLSPKAVLPAATLTALRVRYTNVGAIATASYDAHLLPEVGTAHPGKDYASGY